LVVGRLIRAKGIGPLLDAWNQLPRRVRMRWTLLFVGDGPLAAELRRATEACQPGEIVSLPAVQPEDLPAYYSASQILLFPSLGDPWGLVVNEAFACSRPVVCSSLAGCADDLMLPGENGWITNPSVPGDLTATLLEALEHPDLRQLGVQARHSVERFSPERMAAGILRAVENACAQRRPRGRQAVRT
jgi:glycosyltransferase involved in cell wall biosynthesis